MRLTNPKGEKMSDISMRDMLEAGVHFGHQTKFWNPKMKPYIFGEKSKIHIIDLQQSLPLLQEAIKFTKELASKGGTVLFVGSKRSAKKAIQEYSQECDMPYVCNRWLGGMLTNFETIKKSIKRLKYLEEVFGSEELKTDFTKRELLTFSRELEKLEKTLGGIKDMKRLPDALFIIDVRYEKIAVQEANKLGIPVIGIVDTNSSPDGIDIVVPGNDDAIASVKLYAYGLAKAIAEGRAMLPVSEEELIEIKEKVEAKNDNFKAEATAKITTKKRVKKVKAPEAEAEAAPEAEAEAAPEAEATAKITTKKRVKKVKAPEVTDDSSDKAN